MSAVMLNVESLDSFFVESIAELVTYTSPVVPGLAVMAYSLNVYVPFTESTLVTPVTEVSVFFGRSRAVDPLSIVTTFPYLSIRSKINSSTAA
jgi:hypothetical protein